MAVKTLDCGECGSPTAIDGDGDAICWDCGAVLLVGGERPEEDTVDEVASNGDDDARQGEMGVSPMPRTPDHDLGVAQEEQAVGVSDSWIDRAGDWFDKENWTAKKGWLTVGVIIGAVVLWGVVFGFDNEVSYKFYVENDSSNPIYIAVYVRDLDEVLDVWSTTELKPGETDRVWLDGCTEGEERFFQVALQLAPDGDKVWREMNSTSCDFEVIVTDFFFQFDES